MLSIVLAAAWLVAQCQLPVYRDHAADFAKLTEGVEAIPRINVPGSIVVGGPDSFCIVSGMAGRTAVPVVAAAAMGRGVVLAFGHNGYLDKAALSQGGTLQLVKNAIESKKLAQRATRVAVYKSPALAKALSEAGFAVKEFTGNGWAIELKFYDAVLSASDLLGNGQDINSLVKYIEAGGVFVSAQTGWGWQQTYSPRGYNLAENNHHNAVIRRSGLTYGLSTVGAFLPVSKNYLAATNCQYAMARLIAHRDKTGTVTPQELEQFTGLISEAVQAIHPFDQIVRNPLDAILLQVGTTIVPTEATPLSSADPLKRLALRVRHIDSANISEVEVTPDTAARIFPGLAANNAPRETRTVTINGDVPGWASTGLWVNAGERVTVTIPGELKDKGLLVRVGSHSDKLWNLPTWKRHPDITRAFPVKGVETKARNEFGGLVYIVVPQSAKLGTFQATIAGCVRAPRFVLGETSVEYWRATERKQPGPWAELETGKVVLTVPSSAIRSLEDPDELLRQWDRALDCYAELGRRKLADRPQRVVCDVQISAGYMHSGYPIMMHMDQPDNLVSIHKQAKGAPNNWGFWHELGHNHQVPDWTFVGTTEVTCNLFSMYVLNTLYDVPVKETFKYDATRMSKYFADGSKFAEWRAEPFLALMMYAQLADGLGWEALQSALGAYATLTAAERPKNDDQKRDQWLVRLSQASGRNLGPFFRKWGVPVSQAALDSVADLPAWMHPDIR